MAEATYSEDARLADILDRVEQGEEVTIVRRGTPVARVVPLRPERDEEAVRQALRRMDEIRQRASLRGLRIKDLINEGRP